jgi:hypothetical protein
MSCRLASGVELGRARLALSSTFLLSVQLRSVVLPPFLPVVTTLHPVQPLQCHAVEWASILLLDNGYWHPVL